MKPVGDDYHCPHCWLVTQAKYATKKRLQSILIDLLCTMHDDDIERVFGRYMKKDGYYNGRREASHARDESGPHIILGAGADLVEGAN